MKNTKEEWEEFISSLSNIEDEAIQENLPLIASAPELLEACIKAHDSLLSLHICDQDKIWADSLRDKLKQAITKAETK